MSLMKRIIISISTKWQIIKKKKTKVISTNSKQLRVEILELGNK